MEKEQGGRIWVDHRFGGHGRRKKKVRIIIFKEAPDS